MKKKTRMILEILILSLFLIFSYFHWDNLEINKYANIVKNSEKMNSLQAYEEENISNGILLPLNDEKALEVLKPGLIRVENAIEESKKYEIIFCIDNESTLDYQYLSISIDNKIYKLKEVEKLSDETFTYLIIDKYEVTTENKHKISIWLNEDVALETVGKSIKYYIEIREDLNILAMN